MTTFNQREEAFESRFAHDQDLRFKAYTRRDRALGLWASGLLGKSGADAVNYAEALVSAEIEQGTDEGVFAKLRKDFDAAGVQQSDHQIRRTMAELLAAAVAVIEREG